MYVHVCRHTCAGAYRHVCIWVWKPKVITGCLLSRSLYCIYLGSVYYLVSLRCVTRISAFSGSPQKLCITV